MHPIANFAVLGLASRFQHGGLPIERSGKDSERSIDFLAPQPDSTLSIVVSQNTPTTARDLESDQHGRPFIGLDRQANLMSVFADYVLVIPVNLPSFVIFKTGEGDKKTMVAKHYKHGFGYSYSSRFLPFTPMDGSDLLSFCLKDRLE